MNPEDRAILERSLKLSEDNNQILRGMRRSARWAAAWGVIKLIVLVVPFIIGYFYLEPYFGSLGTTFKEAQKALNSIK